MCTTVDHYLLPAGPRVLAGASPIEVHLDFDANAQANTGPARCPCLSHERFSFDSLVGGRLWGLAGVGSREQALQEPLEPFERRLFGRGIRFIEKITGFPLCNMPWSMLSIRAPKRSKDAKRERKTGNKEQRPLHAASTGQ